MKYSRYKDNDEFYKDRKWIRKRENILRRDDYTCKECSRYGKTTPANTVHHIYPLETHPKLKLVDENLISLCNTCHEQMHNRFTNEITTKVCPGRNELELCHNLTLRIVS